MKLNLIFYFVSFLTIVFLFRNNVFIKNSFIYSDSEGYYAYSPKWFIYKDFGTLPIKTEGRYVLHDTGTYFNKYTCGVAIAQLPFFLSSHLIASQNSSYKADGFSRIYDKGILIAASFYVFLGLLFFYKLLRLLTIAKWISGFMAFVVFFGTNLMYYTIVEPGMSHGYSFGLISLFLYLSFKYRSRLIDEVPILVSLLSALIILIRLPNVIVLIIPLAFILQKFNTTQLFSSWIKSHYKKLLLLSIPTLLLYFFQMIQWHEMTGKWIFSGYGLVEQGFIYWKEPKMLSVLFHLKNGWFIYSPIMLVSILAAFINYRNYQFEMSLILLLFVIFTYIFGSWWVWSFAGAFGHRAYIDVLTIFILPLSLLLNHLYQSEKTLPLYSLLGLVIVLVYFSYGMTLKYSWPWEPPLWTWDKYFSLLTDIALFRYE